MENVEGKKPIRMSKRKFIILIASLVGVALIAFGVLLYMIFGKKNLIEKRKLPKYDIPKVPDGYMLVFREVELYSVEDGKKRIDAKYEYNAKGERIKTIHFSEGKQTGETVFEYDENGELKREEYIPKSAEADHRIITYEVDADGNQVKTEKAPDSNYTTKRVTVTDPKTKKKVREEYYTNRGEGKISVYDDGVLVLERKKESDGSEWESVNAVYASDGELSEVRYYGLHRVDGNKKPCLDKTEHYTFSGNECVIESYDVALDGGSELTKREHIIYDDQGNKREKRVEIILEGEIKNRIYEEYSDWGQQIKNESYTVESGEEKLVLSHVKEYNDQKRLTKDITRNSTGPTQWVEYLYNKSGEKVKEIHYYPDGSIEYYVETTYEEKPNKVVRTKYYKADGTTYELPWGKTAFCAEYDSYGNEVFCISYEHNKAKEMYVHVYKPYVIPKKDDIE